MKNESSHQEEKQVVEYSAQEPTPPEQLPQLASITEPKMDLSASHNDVKDLEVKPGNATETCDINATSYITVCNSTLEEECSNTINISCSTISSLSDISVSDVNATGYLSASCICESGDVNGKSSQKESDVNFDLIDNKEDLSASLKKEIEKDINSSSKNEVTFLKSPENDIKNETLDCQPSFEIVQNENIQHTYQRMSIFIEENDDNISSPDNTAVSINLNSTEYDLVMALESLNINSESKHEETFLSVQNENNKYLCEDSLQDSVYSCNKEQKVGDDVNKTITTFRPSDLKNSEYVIEENSTINDTLKTENSQSETEQLEITEKKSIFQPANFKVSEEVIEINESLKNENNQTEKIEELEVSEEDIEEYETKLEQLKVTQSESTFQSSGFKVSKEVIEEDFSMSDTIKTANTQTEKLEQSNTCFFETPRKSLLNDSSNVSFIDYNSLLEASPSVFNEKMPKYEKQADLLLKINYLQQTLARLELEITKKDRLIIKYQMDKINKSKNNDSSNNICSNITENVNVYQENLKQAQLKISELQKENLEKENKIKQLEQDLNKVEAKKFEIILEIENITQEKEKAYLLLEQSDKVILDIINKYQALNKEKELWKTAYEEINGKYDLAKLVVKGLKENEDIYKKENNELRTKLTEYAMNYECFKNKALAQINDK